MPKTPILLTIKRKWNMTYLFGPNGTNDEVSAGSQYDHEAHELEFIRDEEYVDDTLVLYFTNARVILGTKNKYSIPEVLTQNTSLGLEIGLVRNGTELEHSNKILLLFRPSFAKSHITPEPLPDTILELADQAIVGVGTDGDDLIFTNLQGDERARIPAGSGSHEIESILEHNMNSLAHPNLIVDGNAVQGG